MIDLAKLNIDKTWSLFLDRDGVINRRIIDQYVKTTEEFVFLPGVLEAISVFSKIFGKIIVVTNQQGIGKGIMTLEELEILHNKMVDEISKSHGRIDKIYFCPAKSEDNHPDRKPSIGMGLKAKSDFKEILFKKSIIAGDSFSDMEFGHRLNMVKVFINDDFQLAKGKEPLVDIQFRGLIDFAEELKLVLKII